MALIVGRTSAAEDTADDAIQVVDLDDIVTGSIDDQLVPAHMRRRRRVVPRHLGRPALAAALGLVVLVPVVAALLYVQRESGSRVDTEDGRRPPAELPLPGQGPRQVPAGVDDAVRGRSTGADQRSQAAPTSTTPATSTTAAPTTTTTTLPPTTAAPTTTTPSVTLPDGSPNPLGPGPLGPQDGTTTTMPDPNGPDYTVPG